MATFQVSGPGGAEYEIDAPDEGAALQAYRKLALGDGGATSSPSHAVDAPAAGAAGNDAAAVGRGIINGVPVVGPYLLGGVNRAVAGLRSIKNDTKFSDELRSVERFGEATAKENYWPTISGELLGGAVGTAPLVAAAPVAFGFGAGPLAARALAGGASGAALGAADAAVRNDFDAGEARTGAYIGGGLGLAGPYVGRGVGKLVTAMRGGEKPGMALLREATTGLTEKELGSAQFLRDQSVSGGVPLTLGESLNAATGGAAGRVSQLERVVANSGGEGGRIASEVYAARPAAMDNATRSFLDRVAAPERTPTDLGFEVQAAAQQGIAQTPQGTSLQQSLAKLGPRTTPDQAGQVIQRELRDVRAGREAVRSLQGDIDYGAARAAPERIGIDRTVTVERPGPPVLQTLDNGDVGPLRYDPPPQGPSTLASAAPTRPEAAAPPGARGPSLARYIAENGGIGLERGDIKAAGLDRFRQPGVANLVREDGLSIDNYWRTRLIEQGYLPPDTAGAGMQRNVHDEIINLLEEEARGRRTYPFDYLGKDDAANFGQMRDEFSASASQAQVDLRRALTEAGVDPRTADLGAMDRAAAALVRGEANEPLAAYESVVMASREPASRGPASRLVPTTVTEEISAPRFGQADPQPALDLIDRQLVTAKGDVRSALEATRRDLLEALPDPASGQRETDLSIAGLHQARERLDRRITEALDRGDGILANRLSGARTALDNSLKQAPEMAAADTRFAANSASLEPFSGNAPLGRITQADPRSGRLATPSEEVPSHLRGATAVREFLANGTPAARQAYENRVATQIIEGSSDARGNVNPDALRGALREHADVLAQTPEVSARLERVLADRDAMERVVASPLGQIAERPDVNRAITAVFGPNPNPGSHREVGEAMTALVRNDAGAARELARMHFERVFNEATQQQKGQPALYGGAGFASAVRGNPQQRRNLEETIRALPEGETIWKATDRLLTTLEATGYRPVKGSDTAFNTEFRKAMESGKTPVGRAITDVVTGSTFGAAVGGAPGAAAGAVAGLKRGVNDAVTRASMLGQSEALARLMFNPKALPDLRLLARAAPGSQTAEVVTQRLLALANGAAAPARSQ